MFERESSGKMSQRGKDIDQEVISVPVIEHVRQKS